jgi:hypothetical protein
MLSDKTLEVLRGIHVLTAGNAHLVNPMARVCEAAAEYRKCEAEYVRVCEVDDDDYDAATVRAARQVLHYAAVAIDAALAKLEAEASKHG